MAERAGPHRATPARGGSAIGALGGLALVLALVLALAIHLLRGSAGRRGRRHAGP